MRTDFIGHTYFAKSGSIIDDIRKIFTSDAPRGNCRQTEPACLSRD
jgi:hypothetical protein